ncbi:unnamed protein product [Moneuplotes crassus]|uniref:Nuclear pore complex protein n=1 Tax=Euplotes crassus TaxID=5936 RepID=A0AAD1Y6P5_EUPCR|nr:unnamed protein product [Moneuplotes crassus]
MERESLYKQAYFECLRSYSEKGADERLDKSYKFNFGPSFEFDRNSQWKNEKAKFCIQGSNPVKMIRNLEKELNRLTVEGYDAISKLDYNADHENSSVQEAIKFENISWKLFTECVSADYIHFENIKRDTIPEDQRTPMTLLSDIIKSDHEILSVYYILKWLEKIYSWDMRMPSKLAERDIEKLGLIEDDNLCLKEDIAKFMFNNLRSGRLGQIKDRLPTLVKAWKTSMLQGDMPSLGEVIDPIGCNEGDFRDPLLEKKNHNDGRDCNFSTADYFNHIKICKMKIEFYGRESTESKYKRALYGSFCGDTSSMLRVSNNWDDYLWSYMKTVFFFNVTEKYIQEEEEYLEMYNMTHGDFHCSEEKFKAEFQNWPFPETCPIDFDGILDKSIKDVPKSFISFSSREGNPFLQVLTLLLQIQLKSSKVSDENENRWNILVDKIYDLNQLRNFAHEDLIFLRFSSHLLIMLYILQRIDNNRVERYNDVLFKFINSEEEIDSPMHTFYLNFIIGDDKKVEYYSEQVYSITDKVIQDRILENIDTFLPALKDDFKDTIKSMIVGGIKPKSSGAVNIQQVIKKLNWLFYQDNYLEFYKTVVEVARKYFLNISAEFGYHNYIETLYDELKANLDFCEQNDERFSQDGFYSCLVAERKKHCLLVQLICESHLLKNPSINEQAGRTRRNRILNNIDKVLKDASQGTVLFDYPLETENDQEIKMAHEALKNKLIAPLLLLKIDLLMDTEKFEECLRIMEYILDTSGSKDMQVDSVFGAPAREGHPGELSLRKYLELSVVAKIDSKISDAMMRSPEVVEYLLSN